MKIGWENNNSLMEDCSIIIIIYNIVGECVGGIVFLGFIRMEYSRMMGFVDVMSWDLIDVLIKFYCDN